MNPAVGHWRRFDHRSGLTHDSRCVLADRGGRVWIGSRRRGLSCYDGYSFQTFTTEHGLAGEYVRCLLETRSGVLWIGTEVGLSVLEEGRFSTVDAGPGGTSIRALLEDRDGSIWIGSRTGLYRYVDGSYEFCPLVDGRTGPSARALAQDERGTVWIGTDDGLYSLSDGAVTCHGRHHPVLAGQISSLCMDVVGSCWVGTYDSGLCRYDGADVEVFTREHGLPDDHISCLHTDRHGAVWIGTRHEGVGRYDGDGFTRYSVHDGLAHNYVHGVAEGREGDLWFACWHGGLSCLLPGVTSVSDDPVQEAMVRDAEGRLWWASGAALAWVDDHGAQRLDFGSRVVCLHPDSRGRLWVGTEDAGVFLCADRGDILGSEPSRMFGDVWDAYYEALVIHEASDGAVWVGSNHGAVRSGVGRAVWFTSRDGLATDQVSTICQDSAGVIWLGSYDGGGVTRYDGHQFQVSTTADGLAHDEVLHIARDPDGTVWIATRGGVSRPEGTSFTSLTTSDGLPADTVKHVMVDRRGHLWGATLGAGVFQFDGKNVQTLTEDDGLPSNYSPALAEDRDGSIVIATFRGIRRYAADTPHPPSVRIIGVDIQRWHDAPGEVTTPSGSGRIRVVYRGVSLMTSRMRYAHMLEGVDDTWRSTWDEEVVYEDLPVGDYRFKVKAVNRDLVESTCPAELAIHVTPDTRDYAVAELSRLVGERTERLERAEAEIQRQAALLTRVSREARNILWRAHVELRCGDLVWTPVRREAADFHSFLPLSILPGEDYYAAWARSVLPEDRAAMDRLGNAAILEGRPTYAQGYRCIGRDGGVRWLHEDVTIESTGDGQWTIEGIVTDVTEQKDAARLQSALEDGKLAMEGLLHSEEERSRLIVQMMTVQEGERARIARDLHDHAGQTLSSLLVGLKVLSQMGEVADVRRQAANLREVATQTLEELRALSFDVYPSALEQLGFVAALEQDAGLFQSRHSITVDVHADGEPRDCPPAVKAAIYRVVHAALTNIAQHSQAGNVGIVVRQDPNRLLVVVEDDGVGFHVDTVLAGPVEERFGLLAMQERMRPLAGRVRFESTPGRGTSLFVDAPLVGATSVES
ncbi:PAS domain-containing protein [Candidatus Poribacteria bacterium]|jgi:ligand-binding sensor domain-containing protein/signal transduction histidine kinase|nr:PAS domain-containing protein [Candidatus Poribacteria bacterium]MBT5534722.1 PAS domain-containing protein [Candidatus Poribacteria bacterium]MBT5711032.1 PAS domain-containing protein [Candidatus Poribacteria bacterium]MBT7097931.1 PAS domain-containing protein [Candidatus Poribacteria bacterium]MBT7809600.1 PAS domain-containing protein [Candidatus Poribacteria bacterium]